MSLTSMLTFLSLVKRQILSKKKEKRKAPIGLKIEVKVASLLPGLKGKIEKEKMEEGKGEAGEEKVKEEQKIDDEG